MSVSTSLSNGVSFGGTLVDFATMLLVANWETDCRATVPPLASYPAKLCLPNQRTTFLSTSSLGMNESPPPRRGDEDSMSRRQRIPSDISDAVSNG